MSEVQRFWSHEASNIRCVREADFDRVTAERDAGLAREAALAQNLKYAEQGYVSIAESADASAQTLHEVISRLKAERDALQARLTAADERVDVLETALAGMLFAFDDGVGREWSEDLLDFARKLTAAREFKAALKPAECCTASPEERALLDAGDYTPEELWGVGGKPSCPKCAKP